MMSEPKVNSSPVSNGRRPSLPPSDGRRLSLMSNDRRASLPSDGRRPSLTANDRRPSLTANGRRTSLATIGEDQDTVIDLPSPDDDIPTQPPYLRIHLGFHELWEIRVWRDASVEIVISFLLLFCGRGMGMTFHKDESPSASLLLVGLGVGLCLYILIDAFAHVQVAVMNPSAAVHFLMTGKLSVTKTILYIIAECIGAMLGAGMIYGCAPLEVQATFTPLQLHPGITPLQGVAVEIVVTACMVFVIAGATDERYRKVFYPALTIGISVSTGILAAGNFTGGSQNPIAVFGPAVVTGIWKDHWVYWVGPISGSVIATSMYHFFTYDKGIWRKKDDEPKEKEEKKPKTGKVTFAATALEILRRGSILSTTSIGLAETRA